MQKRGKRKGRPMQQASKPLRIADSPTALPTGFVTLLFSDIEGSTMRWEAYPDAMRAAIRRHDRILHREVEAQGGYVFKTVGDEFCTAFDSPERAGAAAVAIQRALAAEDWSAVRGIRVRMAMHSGVTDERDGDYYGSAVNRVARLLTASHGGQVLVSAATAEALEGRLSGASHCAISDVTACAIFRNWRPSINS